MFYSLNDGQIVMKCIIHDIIIIETIKTDPNIIGYDSTIHHLRSNFIYSSMIGLSYKLNKYIIPYNIDNAT